MQLNMEWLFLGCFFLSFYRNISMSLCSSLVLCLPKRALGTTKALLVLWVTSLIAHKKPPPPDVPPSVILPQQHVPFSHPFFDHWLHLSKGSLSLTFQSSACLLITDTRNNILCLLFLNKLFISTLIFQSVSHHHYADQIIILIIYQPSSQLLLFLGRKIILSVARSQEMA